MWAKHVMRHFEGFFEDSPGLSKSEVHLYLYVPERERERERARKKKGKGIERERVKVQAILFLNSRGQNEKSAKY